MINDIDASAFGHRLPYQWFDELRQVIHLLELAPRILIHAAINRQDVQRFQ